MRQCSLLEITCLGLGIKLQFHVGGIALVFKHKRIDSKIIFLCMIAQRAVLCIASWFLSCMAENILPQHHQMTQFSNRPELSRPSKEVLLSSNHLSFLFHFCKRLKTIPYDRIRERLWFLSKKWRFITLRLQILHRMQRMQIF